MKTNEDLEYGRPIEVKGMAYAPISELGVVYLFGRLAPKLGFQVEYIHPYFPDCIARQHGKLRRIEFELWASDFGNHHHSAKGADMIVCWENDWEDRPPAFRHLKIISLKPYVGAAPRIHVVGCGKANASELSSRKIEWNVSGHTQAGDLALMYRGAPVSAICDAWEVVGPFNRYSKRNKGGYRPGLQAYLKLVTRFKRPLTYDILKRDPRTKNLTVVTRRFRGKMDITLDWFLIYEVLIELNPRAKADLRPFIVE
jgi:hypothetical protein